MLPETISALANGLALCLLALVLRRLDGSVRGVSTLLARLEDVLGIDSRAALPPSSVLRPRRRPAPKRKE